MKFPSLAALLFVAAVALSGAACGGDAAASNTVVIHYSTFEPVAIEARVGQPLTLTIENRDPIEHEWIVGTDDVHIRHRGGTEPYHDQVPTEVTIPAFESRTTTVTFDAPGQYRYICHLPGHEAYGMTGTIVVLK